MSLPGPARPTGHAEPPPDEQADEEDDPDGDREVERLQRVPDLYGHTEAFSTADVLSAFDDLVNWLSSAQKPPA